MIPRLGWVWRRPKSRPGLVLARSRQDKSWPTKFKTALVQPIGFEGDVGFMLVIGTVQNTLPQAFGHFGFPDRFAIQRAFQRMKRESSKGVVPFRFSRFVRSLLENQSCFRIGANESHAMSRQLDGC